MSDERASHRAEPGSAVNDPVIGAETPEAYDADGLPLHRAPTLDDVRGSAGSGRTIAVGCAVLVALAVAAFWVIRAGLFG
jgi:hypothetical protein